MRVTKTWAEGGVGAFFFRFRGLGSRLYKRELYTGFYGVL